MADIVQTREASITAETGIENFFNEVLDRLHAHNSRLIELHDLIKASQPVSSGSVCLELYRCGRGCAGCPHPRWVKYNWTAGDETKPGVLRAINLDAKKKDPILALPRKDSLRETAILIREAKTILNERAKLLAGIRALRYAVKKK